MDQKRTPWKRKRVRFDTHRQHITALLFRVGAVLRASTFARLKNASAQTPVPGREVSEHQKLATLVYQRDHNDSGFFPGKPVPCHSHQRTLK